MKISNKNILSLSVATLIATTLSFSGCGGGGGSSDPITPPSSGADGKVADGYLKNATVCLDKNLNSKCDNGEPTTISKDGGEYTLSNVSAADYAKYPIVVEIKAGVTIDEDDNATATKDYTLSAPAGQKDFISPLSTMLKSYMDNNDSLTLTTAKTKLGQDLGVSDAFVLGDYVLSTSSEAIKAHEAARVVAKLKTLLKDKLVNDYSLDANDSIGGFEALLNEELMKNLSLVKTQLNATSGLDSATVASNIIGNISVSNASTRLSEHNDKITQLISGSNDENISVNTQYTHKGNILYKKYTILDSTNKTCKITVDKTNAIIKSGYNDPYSETIYTIEDIEGANAIVKIQELTTKEYNLNKNVTGNTSFAIRMRALKDDSDIKITASCQTPSTPTDVVYNKNITQSDYQINKDTFTSATYNTNHSFELFDSGNETVPYTKEGNVNEAIKYTFNQAFLINKNIKTCYVNMYSLYSGYKNKMVFRTTYTDVKVYEGNSFEFAKNGGVTSYDQLTYVLRNIDQYNDTAKLYFAPTSDSLRDVYYRVLCTTDNTSY